MSSFLVANSTGRVQVLQQCGQDTLRNPPNHSRLHLIGVHQPDIASHLQANASVSSGLEQLIHLYPRGGGNFCVEAESGPAGQKEDEGPDSDGRQGAGPRNHRLETPDQVLRRQPNPDLLPGLPERGFQKIMIQRISPATRQRDVP
jgi:hypothetical protein